MADNTEKKTLLDKLIGDEGIKTNVAITLTKETYLKLGATIVISGVLVAGTYFMLKGIFNSGN